MAHAPGQSSVRIFLAAALSPHVQAVARWMGVSALSRTAFAIGGKDSGSPLLQWLASGRPRGEDSERCAAAARRLGVDRTVPAAGFLGWYRRLNLGYPFLDYSSDDAFEADARLMASYAARAGAPPPATDWPGTRRPLSAGRLETGGTPQPPGEKLLAGWLRVAGGITRVRRLTSATVTHRTSPSGGARHPTDLAVRLGAGWPAELRGCWWYAPFDHALSPSHWPVPEPASPRSGDVVFAVTSHVERAMWRYRDVRAFRPVLIDAGHIVETLMAAVSSTGWTPAWYPAPGFVAVGGTLDPVFGYVVAVRDECDRDLNHRAPHPNATPTGALRTNPLLSLTVTADAVLVENHQRANHPLPVTPAMADALAWATPSSRRDRPTSPEEIVVATGVERADLDALVAYDLLLDHDDGDRLWRLGRAWFQHHWFLSLLAHAEEAAGAAPAAPARRNAVPPPLDHLPQALDQRRTCRALTGAPLPAAETERVLAAAAPASPGVRVVVVARHEGGGLHPGAYLLDGRTWTLLNAAAPTEQEVIAAAVGQPWARGFALLFWFVPVPDESPGSWEAALVECGRSAQRLALSVSHNRAVGVFQSPALVDELLAGVLQGCSAGDGAYLVGIGVAGDTAWDPPQQFRPSSVFAAPGAVRP